MAKRTARELWDALDEATLDAEMESVLAQTPEERRRDLVAAGYDLDEVHAEADAFFASLPAPAPAPAVVPASAPAPAPKVDPVAVVAPAPKRRRTAVVVSAGLALAAAMALVIRAAQPPPPVGAHPPYDPQLDRAEDLRREAHDACDAHVWKTCVDKLDEARTLDPKGDTDPAVQAMRRSAAGGAGGP